MRFKVPSPSKSSKATAAPTGAVPVGRAPGKRNYDVASTAACNAGKLNPENLLAVPEFPTEPNVEHVDRAPNEVSRDSKEILRDIPQYFGVATHPSLSGRLIAAPAGLSSGFKDGGNWDVINALHQVGHTSIPKVRPPPLFGEVPGSRRPSDGGGSLVPQDIASGVAPAPRPASIPRKHLSFANSGVLPGDIKPSATSPTEMSRTSIIKGFSSEPTGSSPAKRMGIISVCLACIAMLSFWAFYAIAEVAIISREFDDDNGDAGMVFPHDEGTVEMPHRLLFISSGFQEQTELVVPRGGMQALAANRNPANNASSEDFTDAIEFA